MGGGNAATRRKPRDCSCRRPGCLHRTSRGTPEGPRGLQRAPAATIVATHAGAEADQRTARHHATRSNENRKQAYSAAGDRPAPPSGNACSRRCRRSIAAVAEPAALRTARQGARGPQGEARPRTPPVPAADFSRRPTQQSVTQVRVDAEARIRAPIARSEPQP